MFPLISLAFSGFSSRYSPRKGTILGSDLHPVISATRSLLKVDLTRISILGSVENCSEREPRIAKREN